MPSDTHASAVDDLLARYLGLLHEYARLRAQLAADQAALYGHLARANFAAERGFRYGPEHFDGRMQATARLAMGVRDGGGALGADRALPSFAIRRGGDEEGEEKQEDERGEDEKGDTEKGDTEKDDTKKDDSKKNAKKDDKPSPPRDPLRWFGVLTPMALRQAQQAAVHAVDAVVPQLAAVDAEMAAVEIAVRRARKRRARAQAEQAKAEREQEQEQEQEQAVQQKKPPPPPTPTGTDQTTALG